VTYNPTLDFAKKATTGETRLPMYKRSLVSVTLGFLKGPRPTGKGASVWFVENFSGSCRSVACLCGSREYVFTIFTSRCRL